MSKLREQSKVLNVTTSSILAIERFVNEFQAERDRDKIESRLTRLDQLIDRYLSTSINVELMTNENAEKEVDFSEQRDRMEEKYYDLRDFLISNKPQASIVPMHVAPVPAAALPVPVRSSAIRLPQIDLPTFDGDINNWIPFRDAYTALIHRNNDLASVDKFHYLMAALKGSAKKLLDTTSITADNYKIAWDVLVGRYDNKRLLIKNHISALFAIETVRKESSDAVLALVDQFERHVKILTTLGELTESWSSLLVHMVCSRLDKNILREWERSTADRTDEIPTYAKLIEFLHEQSRILLSLNSGTVASIPSSREKPRVAVAHTATSSSSNTFRCAACNQSHRIYDCEMFKRMSLDQKQDAVRKKKLCWNCLSSSHMSRDCPSKPCRKCNEKHHTSLHPSSPNDRYQPTQSKPTTVGSQPTTKSNSSDSPTSTPPATSSHSLASEKPSSPPQSAPQRSISSNALSASHASGVCSTVLLSTAVVKVYGLTGRVTFVRTLLDSCSESNFITERIVQLLGLKRTRQAATISGMGGSTVKSTHCTVATFSSVDTSYIQTLTFSILPKITNDLPARPVNTSHWKMPSNVVLADPDFASPQKIDMVIGAQLFFNLLCNGQLSVGDGPALSQPLLQRTVLGWIVSGPVSHQASNFESTNAALLCTSDELDQQLTKFWELESCSSNRGLSKEELACEKLFADTTTRDESGRFIVRLPIKDETLSQLGDSEFIALRRLRWMQRRLAKNPDLKGQYCEFLHEYMELGHMVPVDSLQDNTHSPSFFLPHHAVIKPTSTTTKCRVVFDGSSKSSTGISLNDCLMVGPTIQDTLYSIVVRIRLREIALVADITKMYRQIWIHPDDRNLQRIFWQNSTDTEVRPYELTTVTYGTASAPYLATRCLQQLSFDHSENENDAAGKIGKDFYVDDFFSGADTIAEAVHLQSEVQSILSTAGFELRKWSSNSAEVLSYIPNELLDSRPILEIDGASNNSISTLGLLWHPESDTLRFKVPVISSDRPITKRVVASEMAKLFDPLGILGPVVIKAKIFIQQLWKSKLSWDETIPDHVSTEWQNYRNELAVLNSLSVPRLVKAPGATTNMQLHGFCDASERAYGACIYLRSVGPGDVVTAHLLTAKSRVAPVHSTTIPRLELCSAVLLSQLYCKVIDSINITANSFFWSDSMIALHWLHNSPSKYKTFVANRVAEVQRLTEGHTWNHVAGLENPADIISRGSNPSELANLAMWWKGPPWLTSDPAEWPDSFFKFDSTKVPAEVLEEKACPTVVAVARPTVTPDDSLFGRYSSLTRLLRIAAYCRRFVEYCRMKRSGIAPDLNPFLTAQELSEVTIGIVKAIQTECFPREMTLIRSGEGKQLPKSWRNLDPFLHDGVLRVGGRLCYSSFSFIRKHPLILPAAHPFTELVIDSAHKLLLHAGPRLMIAHIRERFWPFALRNMARKKVRSCLQCYRVQPRPESQLMGQLPKVRITPARVFLNTGVDFCGPVQIKQSVRRSKGIPPTRAYIAVFVCMATKAAHLELVGDLSTDGFIAALKRFVARRGRPISLYCDNGTNFVGAEKELKTLLKQFLNQQQLAKVASFCAETTIEFHFIPARAPTFGGLWEAAVKSLKRHLRRIVGTEALTFEAMLTVLCQIESCLNSRPLTAFSEDPSDVGALTPGHFLIGSALQSTPEPDLANVPASRLSLWQAIQHKTQQFWKLWSMDYLHHLQQRSKNFYRQPNALVGQLVLLKDDNLPPLKWSMGRIIAVRPGSDGLVRVVSVKVPSGAVFDRPVVKVCLVPINDINTEPASACQEAADEPDEQQPEDEHVTDAEE